MKGKKNKLLIVATSVFKKEKKEKYIIHRGRKRKNDLLQIISDAVDASGYDHEDYVTIELSEGILERLDLHIHEVDNSKQTALHLAVQYCPLYVVQRLLELGADPAAQDKYGMIPAHYAAIAGRYDCLRLIPVHLLSQHDTQSSRTPMHYAAIVGKDDVIRYLLAENQPIDPQDDYGNTPLVLAARYGHPDTVEILIDSGADGEVCNKDSMPAMALVFTAFPNMAMMLLDRYTIKDEHRNTMTIDLESLVNILAIKKVDDKYEHSIYKFFAMVVKDPKSISHPVFAAMTDRMWNGFGKKIFIAGTLGLLSFNIVWIVIYPTFTENWNGKDLLRNYIYAPFIYLVAFLGVLFPVLETLINVFMTVKNERFERHIKKLIMGIYEFEKDGLNHKTMYQKKTLRDWKDMVIKTVSDRFTLKSLIVSIICNTILICQMVIKSMNLFDDSQSEYTKLERYMDIITGIVILLLWVRLFMNCGVSKNYGRFVVYTQEVVDDIKKVGFVFLAVFIPSVAIFQKTIYKYQNSNNSTRQLLYDVSSDLLRMSVVDYDFDEGKELAEIATDGLWWMIISGMWLLVSSVVMVNLLIALMSDRYATLQDRAHIITYNSRATFLATCEIVLGPWMIVKIMGSLKDDTTKITIPLVKETDMENELKTIKDQIEELTRYVRERDDSWSGGNRRGGGQDTQVMYDGLQDGYYDQAMDYTYRDNVHV